MELTVWQLADLKILIKDAELKNAELIENNKKLVSENSRLTANNVEIETFIKDRINEKIAVEKELVDLKEEKDLVNSKYEEDNNARYEDLRVRQTKIEDTEQVFILRMQEVDKREANLVEKVNEAKSSIDTNKNILAEIKQESIKVEKRILDAREVEKQNIEKEKALIEQKDDIEKEKETLEKLKVSNKFVNDQIIVNKNQNNDILIETQRIEKEVIKHKESMKVQNTLLNEVKDYIAQNIEKWITLTADDIFTFISKWENEPKTPEKTTLEENKIENDVIVPEQEKETVKTPIEWFKFKTKEK